jgi:TP901 family phage tail tape measure protein
VAKNDVVTTFSLRDRISQGLDEIGRRSQSLGKKLGAIEIAGGAVSKTLLAAGVAAGLATRDFANFEDSIAALSSLTGGENIDELTAAVNRASLQFGKFTGAEIAQSLADIIRSGKGAKEAIELLNPTLQLAQGNSIGASQAAELLTTTLTQFGASADQAARFADVLQVTADKSAVSVAQLGEALQAAAPLARSLGISMEQTTAIIGALADQGFRGSEAGTALRNVFANLGDDSSKLSKTLREQGITTKNLVEIIDQLKGSADGGKEAILSLDITARPAIQALVNGGSASIAKLTEAFLTADGAAAKIAATLGETLSAAAGRLGNTLSLLSRELLGTSFESFSAGLNQAAVALQGFKATENFETLKVAVDEAGRALAEFFAGALGTTDLGILTSDSANLAVSIGQLADKARDFGAEFGRALNIAQAAVGIFTNVATAIGQISVVITGVAADIIKLNPLVALFRNLPDEIANAVPGLTKFRDGVNEAFFALETASERASIQLGTDLGDIEGYLKTGTQAALDWGKGAQDAAVGVDALATSAEQAAPPVNEISTAMEEVRKSLRSSFQTLGPVTQSIGALGNGATDAAGKTGALSGALRELNEIAAPIPLKIVGSAEAAKKLGLNFGELTGKVSAASSEIIKAFLTLAQGISQSGATAEQQAAGIGAAFEATIAKIGSSAAALDQLKAGLQSLGASGAVPQPQLTTFTEQVDKAKGKTTELAKSNKDVAESTNKVGEASKGASKEVDKSSKSMDSGINFAQIYADKISLLRAEFEKFGPVALEFFNAEVIRAFGDGFGRTIDVFNKALEERSARLREQIQFENKFADAEIARIEQSNARYDEQAKLIAQIRQQYRFLDEERLNKLADALETARKRTEAIQEAAKAAKDELRGIGDTLQDELDRLAGNEAAIETRDFEEKLRRIAELEKQGGFAAQQEAEQARRLARELHEKKLEEIAERGRRERDENRLTNEDARNNTGSGSGSGSQSSGQSAGASSQGNTYNINVETLATDEAELVRKFIPLIERANSLRL